MYKPLEQTKISATLAGLPFAERPLLGFNPKPYNWYKYSNCLFSTNCAEFTMYDSMTTERYLEDTHILPNYFVIMYIHI